MMYNLVLLFRGGARQVTLVFDDHTAARKEFDRYVGPIASDGDVWVHSDDYGTDIAVFGAGPLEAAILQDVSRALEGQTALGVLQVHARKRLELQAGPFGAQIVPGRRSSND